jgi:hypothetical protein
VLPVPILGRHNLLYILLAVLASVVLSHIPLLELAVFPFRLMATFVHESSHALVATLTGGQVEGMAIYSNLSGLTLVRGGAALLIDSAGYVGTALCGAVLLLVPLRYARATLWTLAVLAVLAVLSFHVTLYTAFWGVVFAALCAVVAARGSLRLAALLQAFVAVQLGLNAMDALRTLGLYAVAGDGTTDATNAAAASFLPPLFWTILWSLIALAALGGALWRIALPARPRLGARDRALIGSGAMVAGPPVIDPGAPPAPPRYTPRQ